MKNQPNNQIGTISWFKCETQLPLISNPALTSRSELVLIWKEGYKPTAGSYRHDIELWRHSSGNWQPTHWAYLNLPK